MTLTIRGVDAIGGVLEMPLRGPWVYTGDVDSQSFATGHADLVYAGKKAVTFSGTIMESATEAARTRVRMVGGAGGLSKTLPALGYGETPASTVVRDIAAGCGEALADGVADALRDTLLAGWQRSKGTGNRALEALCDHLGTGWNYRILANGTLWVGKETWDQFTPEPFKERDPDENGVATYAPDQPDLKPGVNVGGKRVSSVKHSFEGSLRSFATMLKSLTEGGDRERKAQEAFVRSKIPELERMATYEARVISQASTGRVDVKSDDERMGDMPAVPLFFGVPGMRVVLGEDVRVKVAFDGAKADRRFAYGFHQDCEAQEITIRVKKLVIEADEIHLGGSDAPLLRSGDTLVVPVGAAGTPTPMPISLAPTVTEPGPPPTGHSRAKG